TRCAITSVVFYPLEEYHRTKCTEVWQSTVQSNRKQYYHKTTENGNTDLLTTRFSLDSKNVTARINWKPPPKTPAMGPLPTRMVAKTKRNLVPPDGGWGWMVVLGACIT
ncbi:hypothetical protein Hamer_G023831, partial [Homarus americanus]